MTLLPAIPSRLWTILAAALIVRLAGLAWFSDIGPLTFDERELNAIAVNLVERGEFAIEDGQPTSKRPPLYPAFVAAIYAVFGVENYQAVRLVQIVINLLIVVVIYRLARDLFDERVALWAAAVSGFYPSLWGHDYLLLTEVLFTLLLCLGTHRLVRFFQTEEIKHIGIGGVILGLAALTRSVLWPFPALFLMLVLAARPLSWPRRCAAGLVFLFFFAATLTPWAIRNTRLQGTLTIVDSIGAQVLKWSYSSTLTYQGETDPNQSEGKKDWQNLEQTLTSLSRRPWALIEHWLQNFREFWRLDRELVAMAARGRFGDLSKAAILGGGVFICGYYVLLMVTSIIGGVMRPPGHRWAGLAAFAAALHICAIHTLVYGHSRYHVPLIPLLSILSANCLVHGRDLRWRDHPVRTAECLLLVGIFAAIILISWVQHDLEAVQQTLLDS